MAQRFLIIARSGAHPGTHRNCRLSLFFWFEDQLRLRDDCRELAVAAGDASLQHDGRTAMVQWDAYGMRRIASRHGGKEIGLALDGGGATAVGRLQLAVIPPRVSPNAMTAPPWSMPRR